MINILIPIVESASEFEKFVNSKKGKNYKFFIGIKQSLAKDFAIKSKNVEVHVYTDNSNKEEIINSLHSCNLVDGKIMILRRVPTEYEFEALEKSDKDIVTLKAKRSKFSSAVKNFVGKIVRKIFGFEQASSLSPLESAAVMGATAKLAKDAPAMVQNARKGINYSKEKGLLGAIRKDFNNRQDQKLLNRKTKES